MEIDKPDPCLTVRGTRHRGEVYATTHKIGPGVIGWSAGARHATAQFVEIDGEEYAEPPELVDRLVTRAAAELPGEWAAKPAQASHALENAESNTSAISMGSAKIAILLLTSRAERSSATIGELTAFTRPHLDRQRLRDFNRTLDEVYEAAATHVYPTEKYRIQLCTIWGGPKSGAARENSVVSIGLNPILCRAPELTNGVSLSNSYRGEFLINLSWVMGCPNDDPIQLRTYIRTTAMWNAAFQKHDTHSSFDATHLPYLSLDEWALMVNAYSDNSVEYLQARRDGAERPSHQSAWSKERNRVLAVFDQLLADGVIGSIDVKGSGPSKKYRLLPSLAHLEAKHRLLRPMNLEAIRQLDTSAPKQLGTPPGMVRVESQLATPNGRILVRTDYK